MKSQSAWKALGADFWVLSAFLVLVFLLGGASRGDVQSLLVLRPLSALVLAYAVWRTPPAALAQHPWLVALTAGLIALPIAHLIPLPPALWTALPGHQILVDVYRTAGVEPGWRPLSMAPSATTNALFSLLAPLAVLLLALRMKPQELFALLVLTITLGMGSGILGMLQLIGGQRGPLYFYAITNYDSAVGFFANRNHQAVFLATLLPMLGLYRWWGVRSVESARLRLFTALAMGLLVLVLLLATGSRNGLAIGVLGALSLLLLRGPRERSLTVKRKVQRFNPLLLIAPVTICVVTLLAIALGRADTLTRLFQSDPTEDKRLLVWGPIAQLAREFLPFGTGVGAFVEPYQMREPDFLVGPTYLNHAHNDWLEVAMTAGVPGIALLLLAIGLWAGAAWRLFRQPPHAVRSLGRLALVILALVAAASVADYPLRTPALMCLLALMTAMVAAAGRTAASDGGEFTSDPAGDRSSRRPNGLPSGTALP